MVQRVVAGKQSALGPARSFISEPPLERVWRGTIGLAGHGPLCHRRPARL